MAIAADTKVETIRGPYKAAHIRAGDWVFGMDGLPTRVKSVQTYVPQAMYYVEFSDGSNLEGDDHLAFPTKNWIQRLRYARGRGTQKNPKPRRLNLTTTTDLVQRGLRHKDTPRFEYTVDTVAPLQYGYEDHAVSPFVAGLWYAKRFKNNKYKLPKSLFEYCKANIQASGRFKVKLTPKHFEITPSVEATFVMDYPTIPTREFPHKYWYGMPEQRLEFLQGYFAVNHKCYQPKHDKFHIVKKNPQQLYNIQILCESLGIKTLLQKEKIYYTLTFKTKLPILPIQKQAGRKTGEKYRRIVKVEQSDPRPCVHIETEKPIAVSDSFVPIWHLQPNKIKS